MKPENLDFNEIHVITVMWGETFTRHYIDVTLDNLLWPGNVPAFQGHDYIIFKIYASDDSVKMLEASDRFNELKKYVRVQLLEVQKPDIPEHMYSVLASIHKRAIEEANQASAALLFLAPDLIFAAGSFEFALSKILEGYRLITDGVVRLDKDTFTLALQEIRKQGKIPSNRELVKLGCKHLHPVSKSLFWDTPTMSFWPSHLCWTPKGDVEKGFIMHSYHISLMYVNPVKRDVLPTSTVDDDFLHNAVPVGSKEYCVPSSDQMLCFELSSPTKNVGNDGKPRKAGIFWIAKWASKHCNTRHRGNVYSPVFIHSEDVDADWHQTEKKALATVTRIGRWSSFFIRHAKNPLVKLVLKWIPSEC